MFSHTASVLRAAFSSDRGDGLVPIGAALCVPGAAAWEVGAYAASRTANALAALRRSLAGACRRAANALDPQGDEVGSTDPVPTMEQIDQQYTAWCDQQEAEMMARQDGFAALEAQPALETVAEAQGEREEEGSNLTIVRNGREIMEAVSLALVVQRCGSVRKAARQLGIPESTLRRRLKATA